MLTDTGKTHQSLSMEFKTLVAEELFVGEGNKGPRALRGRPS
jgi:hypothetical protein